MTLSLRGHHLLCLLGYRGKGYSEGFCANMTDIYEQLRLEPETLIQLIEGPDEICRAFPKDQEPHCNNNSVYRKDAEIAGVIGIQVNEQRSWAEICNSVIRRVQPDDIATLCNDCQWEPYGLCREGVSHLHEKRNLRELPVRE